MKLEGKLPFRMALVGLPLLTKSVMATSPSDNLSQEYCSNDNTGSDYTPTYNIYMSMGKCFNECQADYAFAVVQDKNCWCSNYVPASHQDTGSCSQACPGYPDDQCGNSNDNLYGYIPLYKNPSGTAGAASSTQPASSLPPPTSSYEPKTSTVSRTVTQTVTHEESQSPRVVTSYVTPTPSSSSIPSSSSSAPSSSEVPTTSSATSSTTPSPTTPSPVMTVRVTTVHGSVVTQTVTATPSPVVIPSGGASDSVQMHRKGLSGGAIAGIVVGTLIGAAALILAAFLLWRRRRENDTEGAGGTTKPPKRTTSVLSRTGLLARARPQSMSENTYDDPVYANNGINSVRHSMMFGAGATVEGVSPVSPLGGSEDNVSSRRHSKPLVYDQRLNPSALFANPEANNSRVSMQDQQDYSRPLGIINPDWRSSFDSR